MVFVNRLCRYLDRMQRNFGPMRKQAEAWQRRELTDVTAKVGTYEAFSMAKSKLPKRLHSSHVNATLSEWGNRPFGCAGIGNQNLNA
jgi:hypothetical protein